MSEVKKIATRDSYGAALVELAKDHPDVVVLSVDEPPARKAGVMVTSVDELVEKLKNEAHVL